MNEVERQAARIEGLIEVIEASADAPTRDAARELSTSLLALHRAGLARILEILGGAGPAGVAAIDACARDELVASLLALHELGPPLPPPGLVTLRVPSKGGAASAATSPAPTALRCEQCGAALGEPHAHLLERGARELRCACLACVTLLGDVPGGRLARVPRRVLALGDLLLTEAQWDALGVPVNLAFFFRSTPAGRVIALYPSAAGALESLLPLAEWAEIVGKNPILATMQPDVEALFVSRLGARRTYFLLPIDRAFELVGLIRAHRRSITARGLEDGGGEIDRFMDQLAAEAR